MTGNPAVVLDSRDSAKLLAALLLRRLGYVREWAAPQRSAGWALASVAARQIESIVQRLNQVPEKQKLAFLDLLGVGLIPAQPARAPVVFQLSPQAQGGSAPRGTQVSAPAPPGSTQPVMFETERGSGLRAGKLVEVFSLWPGRDQYIDHSAAYAAAQPVRAFSRSLLNDTPHHLYLSHDVLLALAGDVELNVEFELSQPSRGALDLVWEYWDGQVWRGFLDTSRECQASLADQFDSTRGLTRSGAYVLKAACAQASKTTVNGVEGFWLRARLDDALPADSDCSLAEAESIRIASTVNRALRGSLHVAKPAPLRPAGIPVTNLLFPFISSSGGFGPVASIPATAFEVVGSVLTKAGQPVPGALVIMTVDQQQLRSLTVANGTYRMSAATLTSGSRVGFRVIFGDVEFGGPDGPVPVPELPSILNPVVDLTIEVEGLQPDKAFADAITLDVSKPFYPVGQQPQPGSTFYFTSKEILTKPGAKARMWVARTRSPQDEAQITDNGTSTETDLDHKVAWEYWNSRTWAPLAMVSNLAGSETDLDVTEILDFVVPIDLAEAEVNGEKGLWVRMRLQSGSYGFRKEVAFQSGGATNRFTYVIARPPALSDLRFGYTWQYGPFHPETVLTFNDFQYEDHTYESTWPGSSFAPFERVSDVKPALYLGFERKPPVDTLGIYFDIVETADEPAGPPLFWQYWNGLEWRTLSAEDETGNLRRAGMVSFLAQPDDSALARFGRSRYWIRAALKEDGPPGEPELAGIFPNATWATQRQTLRDVEAGTSNGRPLQVFTVPQTPVMPGERLEVRELSGARANVEWRILAAELFGGDTARVKEIENLLARIEPGGEVLVEPLRLRRDRRNRITEAWVLWESRDHLFLSAAGDRHYTLDRALGKLYFGDGEHGRVPPAGATIMLRLMATGGGLKGNVAKDKITQLAGVLPGVQSVSNARAGEGGANAEPVSEVLDRGPATVRHRGRAVAAADYVTMAYEASPAVAFAAVLPGRNPAGLRAPGWVTLVIAPESEEPRPYPSFGLREHVRRYLEQRGSADIAAAHQITVTGPDYLAIDVEATLAPVDFSEAGLVERKARQTLESFLHPLRGGPEGRGWNPGRDVYQSDVVSVLERVEGINYVEEIALLRNGVPQGDRVRVPDGNLVVAGTILLKVKAAEE